MNSLETTNILLSVLTALSVLEALAFLVVLIAGVLLLRRVASIIAAIESEHVAPAAARLRAILDDINDVTSEVKSDVNQIRSVVRWATRWITIPSRWSKSDDEYGKEAPHA